MKWIFCVMMLIPVMLSAQDSKKEKVLLLTTGYEGYGSNLVVSSPYINETNTAFNEHFGLYFMNPSIRWISENGFQEVGIRNVHLNTTVGGVSQSGLFGGRQLGIVNFDIYATRGIRLFERKGTVTYFSMTPTVGYTYSQQFSNYVDELHFECHELVSKVFAGFNFTRFFGDRLYTDAALQTKVISFNYLNYHYGYSAIVRNFNRISNSHFTSKLVAPYINVSVGVKL